jgi:flagellar biosynthesis protein FlhB
MAEQDTDRNEAATPYKLEKAREKGQVAKSADVVSALVFTAAIVFLTWRGWETAVQQLRFDHALLVQAARMESGAALLGIVGMTLSAGMELLAPLFLTLVVVAVAANVLQTGPLLSFEVVKMDFDRINPVNGFKKVFSMRTLFDTARACVKLLLLSIVAYYALKALLPQFYGLAGKSAAGNAKALLDDISSLGMKMALILCAIALIDLLYSRYEFSKKMRMSVRDIKDEVKHREGDPRIRAKVRELRREALKRSMALGKTRNADVLLTNPTHFAVALRYVHGEMDSPQLIAKGAGDLAASMRKIAARHGIPVVQNPTLARKLFHDLAIDQHVPPALFADVARIIVWVFAMRESRTRQFAGESA